jgi:ATP-binding cassette, subfamily C, bacterial
MEKMNNRWTLIRLIELTAPLIPLMVVSVLLGAAGNFAAVSMMVLGGVHLAGHLPGSVFSAAIVAGPVLLLLSGLLRGPLRFFEHYTGHFVAFRLLAILRNRAFKNLKRLAPAKLTGSNSGDIVSSLMGDIEYIEVFFAHTAAPVFIALIVNSSLLVFLGQIWAGAVFILLPFYFAVGVFIPLIGFRIDRKAGASYRKTLGKTNAYVIDSFQGLRELLLFNCTEQRKRGLSDKSSALNAVQETLTVRRGIVTGIANLFIILSAALIVIIGAGKVVEGAVSMENYLISVILAVSGYGPLLALSALPADLAQVFPAAKRIFQLMDEPPAVKAPIMDIRSCSVSKRPEKIILDHVSFSYPGTSKQILTNVFLTIGKGEKVGIVGESGAGKSTFARLLLRFYDPTEGVIRVGGRRLDTISFAELYSLFTIVPQETYIFNKTLGENIMLGKPEASIREVKTAAESAGLSEFIAALPHGYETPAGELGSRLSAGERQRVSIARVLLKDSEIIILDEPTSNLDSINERRIVETMKNVFSDKTVIIISHRRTTLSWVDTVYQVEGGSIREEEVWSAV